jgi:PAS domain S-box-containing protein
MNQEEIAAWLMQTRPEIEAAMNARLGPAAPSPASQENEALRRFRTFSSTALIRGEATPPNLDGLRVNQRRTLALLEAWLEAATLLGADHGEAIQQALRPLVEHFALALRTNHNGRKLSGRPRLARRAVSAAIDRVADGFLAIDTDSGAIEDANPAAGALLGIKRDALLGVGASNFVSSAEKDRFWQHLDSMTENNDTLYFSTTLRDAEGKEVEVAVSASTFATRTRTLALLLTRPAKPLTRS